MSSPTMTESNTLRDKDHAILEHISNGKDDTRKITQATTLEDYEVRYSFEKLENLGLVTIRRDDEMIERVVDGRKQVFKAPYEAELTDDGRQYLDTLDKGEKYQELNRGELIDKVHDLEQRIEYLETAVEMLTNKFQSDSHPES